jgi:phage shock protein A
VDPIDEAKAEMKKHAANALARKEDLEAQLVKLNAQRDELRASREAAESAGNAELLAEIDDVAATLDQNIESMEGQVAIAANTVDDVVAQMNELEGSRSQLEREALVGKVRALTGSDPFSMDPVDRALANVRDHAAQMEAELAVGAAVTPRDPAPAKPTEADLRAQLEALKAQKRAEKAADDDDDDDPTGKPKRTL